LTNKSNQKKELLRIPSKKWRANKPRTQRIVREKRGISAVSPPAKSIKTRRGEGGCLKSAKAPVSGWEGKGREIRD